VRHTGTIAARELRGLFSTPVAYVLLALFLVIAGYFFFIGLGVFLQELQMIQAMRRMDMLPEWNLNRRVIAPSFGTFSVIFLLLIPLLTMRAFAEERAQGTVELLLTSPLTTWEIVLGKYLALFAMVGLLVLFAALYAGLLFLYGNPELLLTLAGLIGLALYGAALAALGCFVSTLTRSQMIAAVVALIAGLVLFLLDVVAQITPPGAAQELLRYLGLRSHFENMLGGELRSEDLVYFGAVIVLFLVLARTSVESLRWR
jgi:ABC-2 type transport system permease protein